MHPYPHTYVALATGEQRGPVTVDSPELPCLQTEAPPEFDGPGGVWSPETLVCASIVDCFVLTFRAVSRAARFEWSTLECQVEGVLEKVDAVSQFTRYKIFAKLIVPVGTDEARARELLERAERGCLIANSLRGVRELRVLVVFEAGASDRAEAPRVSPGAIGNSL